MINDVIEVRVNPRPRFHLSTADRIVSVIEGVGDCDALTERRFPKVGEASKNSLMYRKGIDEIDVGCCCVEDDGVAAIRDVTWRGPVHQIALCNCGRLRRIALLSIGHRDCANIGFLPLSTERVDQVGRVREQVRDTLMGASKEPRTCIEYLRAGINPVSGVLIGKKFYLGVSFIRLQVRFVLDNLSMKTPNEDGPTFVLALYGMAHISPYLSNIDNSTSFMLWAQNLCEARNMFANWQ